MTTKNTIFAKLFGKVTEQTHGSSPQQAIMQTLRRRENLVFRVTTTPYLKCQSTKEKDGDLRDQHNKKYGLYKNTQIG